ELIAQQDEAYMRLDRVFEGGGRIVPLQNIGLVKLPRCAGDDRQGEKRDEDLREINGQGATGESIDHGAQRLVGQRIEDEAQRKASKEDEKLGRIRQGIFAERVFLEHDARHMIDENRHQCKAAPEIDAVRRPHAVLSPVGILAQIGDRTSPNDAFLKRNEVKTQTAKLVPQPQEATALGFSILKAEPIRSSTKSMRAPLMKSSDSGSMASRAFSSPSIRSPSSAAGAMSKLYWKPEQPPPLTEMRSTEPGDSSRKTSATRRRARS